MAGSAEASTEAGGATNAASDAAIAAASEHRARPAGGAGPAAARATRIVDLTALVAVIVAFAALAVYRTTLLPGVGFWDTAEAQTVLPVLGTMHPTGFPAFVILGWLFSIVAAPLGQPAFLMNLFAATCAAVAAGVAVLVMRRLAVPLPIAAAAGIGFALSPVVWHISTSADAHALHIALVAVLTLALVRWNTLVDERDRHPLDPSLHRRADRGIVLAAVVYGVAAANHGLALILVPPIVLFVLAVDPGVLRRPRLILAAIGAAALVAALLYLELPLRAGLLRAPLVYAHPDTWSGFWDVVLAKQFQGDLQGVLSDLPAKADALLTLGSDQFGPLVALLPVGLIVVAMRQPKYALLSGTASLITILFASSYTNADITRYYLGPIFFAWTWLALLAAAVVEVILFRPGADADQDGAAPDGGGAVSEGASGFLPAAARPGARSSVPGTLSLLVGLAFAVAILVPTATQLDARWRAVNESGDTEAQTWLDDAFASMAPDAVVVSWWSYSTTMWYGRDVEHRRADLLIIDDSNAVWDHLGSVPDVIDRYLGSRPVYVIRMSGFDIQNLAQRYAIQPVGRPGNLFRVTGRLGTTP